MYNLKIFTGMGITGGTAVQVPKLLVPHPTPDSTLLIVHAAAGN